MTQRCDTRVQEGSDRLRDIRGCCKVGEEGWRAVGLRGKPSVLHVPKAGQERRPEYPVPGWVRISQYKGMAVCVSHTH
eukprot:SAG31_NODE_17966_length_651_cov_1.253623_1_plen_78_part_00